MGVPAWMFSGIGGSIGGAITLILIADWVEWLYGGQPAHPTTEGFVFIGIYGSIWGTIYGSIVGRLWLSGHRQSTSVWVCLPAFLLGLVVGGYGAYRWIPFSAPIPLEVD